MERVRSPAVHQGKVATHDPRYRLLLCAASLGGCHYSADAANPGNPSGTPYPDGHNIEAVCQTPAL